MKITTIPEATTGIDIIKFTVAKEFGIKIEDLESEVRREPFPMIRHVAMALCKELVEYVTLQSIAEAFKRTEHQTVLHAIKATKTRCDLSPTFKVRIERVRQAAIKGLKEAK